MTMDLFFSLRRQKWGLRVLYKGVNMHIMFHADLYYLMKCKYVQGCPLRVINPA